MPGRRRRRSIVAFALVVAFVPLLWGTTIVVRYVGAEAQPSPDLMAPLRAHFESVQPDGEDAWPVYERLFRLLADRRAPEDLRPGSTLDIGWLFHGSLDDRRLYLIRRRVEFYRPLLRVLDEAAERPACRWTAPDSPHEAPTLLDAMSATVDTDRFSAMRNLATINAVAMRIAGAEGDWTEVVRRLRTGLMLARHGSLRPMIMDALVAESIRVLVTGEAGRIALEYGPPEAVCAQMMIAVRSIRSAPAAHTLEGERLLEHVWLDWTHAPQERGGAALLHTRADPSWPERLKNLAAVGLPSRAEAAAEIDRVYDGLIEWSALPPDVRGEPPMSWGQHPGGIVNPVLNRVDEFARSSVFAPMTPPPPVSIADDSRRTSQDLACILALCLAAYRDVTGKWPDDLRHAALPEETVDPLTGKAFGYDPEPVGEPPLALPVRLTRWDNASGQDVLLVRPRDGLEGLP